MPVIMAHLFELCPTCAEEFEAFRTKAQDSEEDLYNPELERVSKHACSLRPRVEKAKEQAEPLVLELLSLPQEVRLEKIRETSSSYRGPALAALLLKACRSCFLPEPQEALRLAGLAQAVIAKEATSPLSLELYAQAMAYGGNSKRVCGDPQTANADFEQSRFILRAIGGGDGRVQAEIDSLEGCLRRDLRDFETAKRLFHRAARTYTLEQENLLAAQNWFQLAVTHSDAGETLDAIRMIRKALENPAAAANPDLVFMCRHTLANCLCDANRPQEAREILEENRDLYAEHADAISLLRLAWVEGKIARGLGDLAQAEAHFLAAREGFQTAGIAYDMALVSLELAGVYLAQRRAEEVKDLAMEMVTEFQRQKVGREVLSAVILFHESAKLEQVTAAWLQKLIHYLPRAQRDPRHAFEEGS
jgi:tetratricopeptide (TPR) repeat protein